MRRTGRLLPLLLVLASTLLAGCALLSVVAVPFKLLFQVFESIGSGLGSAVDAVAFIDVREGVTPRLVPLGDGQFAVDDLREGARFDVVLSAPGRTPRRYRWPEDLAGRGAPGCADIEVPCVLEAE